MPYLLRFDGVNDYVEADFTQPSSGQITLEIDFQMPTSPQNDRKVFSFSTANNDTRFLIRYFSNGTIGGFIIRTGVFRAIPASSSGYSGQRVKIRMEYYPARGETDFYINDQLESTSATNLGNLLNLVKVFLGRENSNFTGYSEIDLHSASVSINSTVISNYDSSASNGTGLILPDTVGSNDGTLVNFPTDNSQWVFFSGGGATYTITLDSGSYSLSGQDVALLSNKLISLESGAYTYDGQNVDLFAGRSISLEQGNYAYAGQNINLLASRSISLEPANYTYTGQDVTLVYNPSGGPTYLLTIDAGAYNYSGQDTQLIANRTLSIDSGAYAYTGSDLSLLANRSISIDSGAYVVTGNAVVLSANRAITLDAGNYAYTGSPVTLSYSGEVIALVSGYSVNYAQDAATATYTDDYIKARFI